MQCKLTVAQLTDQCSFTAQGVLLVINQRSLLADHYSLMILNSSLPTARFLVIAHPAMPTDHCAMLIDHGPMHLTIAKSLPLVTIHWTWLIAPWSVITSHSNHWLLLTDNRSSITRLCSSDRMLTAYFALLASIVYWPLLAQGWLVIDHSDLWSMLIHQCSCFDQAHLFVDHCADDSLLFDHCSPIDVDQWIAHFSITNKWKLSWVLRAVCCTESMWHSKRVSLSDELYVNALHI